MDAQDAQDNQDGTLLHARLTPAMIVCGFADVQDCKAAVSRKILCIHVNKNRPVLDFEPVSRHPAQGVGTNICLRYCMHGTAGKFSSEAS